MIREVFDVGRVFFEFFGKKRDESGVEIAGTGAHHGAFERRKSHGGIDGLSVADGRDADAVSNVTGEEVFMRFFMGAEPANGLFAHVCVADSVKAEFSNVVLAGELVGEAIEVGIFRKRGMERSVEYRNIGEFGKEFGAGANAFEVRRIVEWGKVVELGQVFEDAGGQEGGLLMMPIVIVLLLFGLLIFFTSVDHAMPNGVDLFQAAFAERVQSNLKRLSVAPDKDFFLTITS